MHRVQRRALVIVVDVEIRFSEAFGGGCWWILCLWTKVASLAVKQHRMVVAHLWSPDIRPLRGR